MKIERYIELSSNQNEKLTKEEVNEGWHFCYEKWDSGMLVHSTWRAAEFCSCDVPRPTDKSLGILK